MRPFLVAAFALTLVTSVSAASADDAKPRKPKATASAPAPKKVGKNRKQPAPKKTAPAPVTPSSDVAVEPTPAPAKVEGKPAPQPLEPDAAADGAAPVATTTTTSATVAAAPTEPDHAEKKPLDPIPPFSAAPLAGVGFNGYGLGLGARIGYTVPGKTPLYVGAGFMYHLPASALGLDLKLFYPSAEVGYDLRVTKDLVIRPYGGVGVLFLSADSVFGMNTPTVHALAIYPGCTISYNIPKSPVFVGGDARLVLAPQLENASSLGLFGSAGVHF
ncbi:MAG: hypothetical protein JWP97_3997 [Labilithrix sp.]|nr:hypothetical protein [Labilithrix sp.]